MSDTVPLYALQEICEAEFWDDYQRHLVTALALTLESHDAMDLLQKTAPRKPVSEINV
jgi:hypothetical protein